MKCIIFVGKAFEVQDLFNIWAKGKQLTREVLIHAVPVQNESVYQEGRIAMIIYYPEGSAWDKTPEQPTPQTREVPITARKTEVEAISA